MQEKTKDPRKQGGYRPGAGRKRHSGKFKEPTHAIRVPLSALGWVKEWLDHLQHHDADSPLLSPFSYSNLKNKGEMDLIALPPSPHPTAMPFYDCRVSAGFPSPADDSFERTMDLNTYLVHNKAATFFVRTSGESMINAGIQNGGLLVVDRSITPKHHDIVIAAVNGDLTVKRLVLVKGKTILRAENPDFLDLEIHEDIDLHLWGVVTTVIHPLRPSW